MSAFLVRKASLNDAEALNEMINQAAVNMYMVRNGSSLKDTCEFIQRVKENLLVAEYNGKAVGQANYELGTHKNAHTASFGIAVNAGCHGKGIGTVLMNALFDELRAKGVTRLESHGGVFADNKAALSFYTKLGFKVEGLQHKAYKRGNTFVDGVRIVRFL